MHARPTVLVTYTLEPIGLQIRCFREVLLVELESMERMGTWLLWTHRVLTRTTTAEHTCMTFRED